MEIVKEYPSTTGTMAIISHDPHYIGGYKLWLVNKCGCIIRTHFFATEKNALAAARRHLKREDAGRYKQWVADCYHCSGIWGQKQTAKEMLLELTETMQQISSGDYCPSPALYLDCMHEWNRLCNLYPN